jgi:hypothetical protein
MLVGSLFLVFAAAGCCRWPCRGAVCLVAGSSLPSPPNLPPNLHPTHNPPNTPNPKGVGKTAVVEGLAQRIASNDVPDGLKGCRVIALEMGLLMAGAAFPGEFEERLRGVLRELQQEGLRCGWRLLMVVFDGGCWWRLWWLCTGGGSVAGGLVTDPTPPPFVFNSPGPSSSSTTSTPSRGPTRSRCGLLLWRRRGGGHTPTTHAHTTSNQVPSDALPPPHPLTSSPPPGRRRDGRVRDAQAAAVARRGALPRLHLARQVPEVHREGPGAGAAVPAGGKLTVNGAGGNFGEYQHHGTFVTLALLNPRLVIPPNRSPSSRRRWRRRYQS